MEKVISRYLRSLKIPISKNYCEKLIASHPDYGSLVSVSDTLERLGIPFKIFRHNRENLNQLPIPFVIQTNKGGGELILVRNEKDLEEKQEVLKDWDGVVLLVDKVHKITVEDNRSYLSDEKALKISSFLFILSAVLLLIFSISLSISWVIIPLIITALTGVSVGYLLFAKDLGIRYEAVESFCKTSKKTNCDRVLNSQEALFLGKFKLSDIVFSFFIFQVIVLGLFQPLYGSAAGFVSVLSIMSALALPFVGYSIFTQAVKIKSWCKLCLIVDAILLAQFVIFGWMFAEGFVLLNDISLAIVVVSILILVATSSPIFFLKKKLEAGNRSVQEETKAKRIKNNPFVFFWLLNQQNKIDDTLFDKEILIGSSDAPIRITMAASFGCGPCKEGFQSVSKLLSLYPEKVSLAFRFVLASSENGHEDPATYVLDYWLENIEKSNNASERTKELINDWYNLSDMKEFKTKYRLDEDIRNKNEEHRRDIDFQQRNWFKTAEIKGTPSFFIRGYNLPVGYSIGDLKEIIPGLAANLSAGLQTPARKK